MARNRSALETNAAMQWHNGRTQHSEPDAASIDLLPSPRCDRCVLVRGVSHVAHVDVERGVGMSVSEAAL